MCGAMSRLDKGYSGLFWCCTLSIVLLLACSGCRKNEVGSKSTSDATPPTVVSSYPLNNATAVSINVPISATFSKAIDSSTINTSTFTISGISGTVSYSNGTANFIPSSNLDYNTLYTATITTSVTDISGNAMTSNYTWRFTTALAQPSTFSNPSIIVDDYAADSTYRQWYYSRIGTDRGVMGSGTYTVSQEGGSASVQVTNGWGGVWTSLKYNAANTAGLDPVRLLGPYVKDAYQAKMTGVEVHVLNGSGTLKVEIKDSAGNLVGVKSFALSGSAQTLIFDISPTTTIKYLNWLVDGAGSATVDTVIIKTQTPTYNISEAAFLFSYGHLSQCYDEASGLVRDRANWPVEDFASIQTIGTFALATAAASQLGYVDNQTAKDIVIKTSDAIQSLPTLTSHGLLPHFLTKDAITTDTEWSSLDTVITLFGEILACQALGIRRVWT